MPAKFRPIGQAECDFGTLPHAKAATLMSSVHLPGFGMPNMPLPGLHVMDPPKPAPAHQMSEVLPTLNPAPSEIVLRGSFPFSNSLKVFSGPLDKPMDQAMLPLMDFV